MLRQIGLTPGTGRYENSSRFAAALQAVMEVGDRSNTAREMLCVSRNERHNADELGIVMDDNKHFKRS